MKYAFIYCLGPPCCFHQVEVHHFNRPKLTNNSLIRDQKSDKHIANRYKKLVYTFRREAVLFFVAKNFAVNHLPLEALPAVQRWTANCKRDRKAVVTWNFAVCGLQFPVKNVMLKLPGPYTASFQAFLGQCISVTYPRRTAGRRLDNLGVRMREHFWNVPTFNWNNL